jgi:ribosomal-protein-alanine N-acetyltransferase
MVLTAGVAVRPAMEQDLEQVVALNRAALPENYMSEFFANLLRTYGELFLTAEIDGRIVGYVMCRIELGMPTGGAFGIIKKGHVVSLAVDKDVRRGGIGYALMQEVLRRMNGAGLKECFLEVRVNNEPAIKLYEKLGFRVVKKIAFYYSDGTDGYVMALGL